MGIFQFNALLNRVHQSAAKLAKEAGFKATLEVKARYHIVERPTADYDDPAFLEALPWYHYNPTQFNTDHPLRITDYGEAVNLPTVTTPDDMKRLEAAEATEASFWAILRDADAKTIMTHQTITWANVVEPKDAISRKIQKMLNDDAADSEDTEWTPAPTTDHAILTSPDFSYMERIRAGAYIAMREAKGDQEQALDIALIRFCLSRASECPAKHSPCYHQGKEFD